jgi:hypothetical protein
MLDPTKTEIQRRKIEVLRMRGDPESLRVADDLEAELDECAESPDADEDWHDSGGIDRMPVLEFFPPQLGKMLNQYMSVVGDLCEWSLGRLSLIPGFHPAVHGAAVVLFLSRAGELDILGDDDVSDYLPPKDDRALDRVMGRTDEDIEHFLEELATGVPDREVSKEMGSKEAWYGLPHQQAQSLKSRLHSRYVQKVLAQFKKEFRGLPWWSDVEIERTNIERCRASKTNPDRAAWRLIVRTDSPKEAAREMDVVDGKWRCVLVEFKRRK